MKYNIRTTKKVIFIKKYRTILLDKEGVYVKNIIMYYYNLNNIKIYKSKNKKYIKYKNSIYIFELAINKTEILEIYNLLQSPNKFYKIILNKDKNIFTPYNGKMYVLLKKNNIKENISDIIIEEIHINNMHNSLDRTNWSFLWSKKIDYYEYQIKHIKRQYITIDESFQYFIGLAENAISYFESNCKNINKSATICHRRIIKNEFYNPLNIVIDYKERDIGEYLKYIFWNSKDKYQNIDKVIDIILKSNKNIELIYCRLLYPSFYFDIYDKIVNSKESVEKIKEIINRIDEYEEYLNYIYSKIKIKKEIPEITWLKNR